MSGTDSASTISLENLALEVNEYDKQSELKTKFEELAIKNSRLTEHLMSSKPGSLRGSFSDDGKDDIEKKSFEVDDHSPGHKCIFSPHAPLNSPVVLSWQNLTVATTTATPKVLLDNISGSITGGFWAIMGASGGGDTTATPITPSFT